MGLNGIIYDGPSGVKNDAKNISYDNNASALEATNIQSALDEVNNKVVAIENGNSGGGINVQSNWSENVSTSPSYVKNRTHYMELATEVLLEQTTVNQNDILTALENVNYDPILECIVILDGVRYICERWQAETGEYYYGNLDEMGFVVGAMISETFGGNSEENYAYEWWITLSDDLANESHTLQIEVRTGDVIYYKLNENYIPNTIARVSEIIENGTDVISATKTSEGYDMTVMALNSIFEGGLSADSLASANNVTATNAIIAGSADKTTATSVTAVNSGHKVSLHTSATGNGGVYDDTHKKWIIYNDTSGNAATPNSFTVGGALKSNSTINGVTDIQKNGTSIVPVFEGNATKGCIKFPSTKTMIAWNQVSWTGAIVNEWTPGSESDEISLGNWYSAFNAAPSVSYSVRTGGHGTWICNHANSSATYAGSVYLIRMTIDTTVRTYTVTAMAVGTYA